MPKLYVVRHGEPAVRGVLLGQSDPPLSDVGLRQAMALANALPASVVYCSPLRRAVQTAQCVWDAPIILPELAEITYGEWDGRTWAEIELKWPQLARQKLEDWEGVIPPGGESWQHFRRRVSAALAHIAAGALPASLIAHEAVNAAIAKELKNHALQSYKQSYCDILEYEIGPEQ